MLFCFSYAVLFLRLQSYSYLLKSFMLMSFFFKKKDIIVYNELFFLNMFS